LTQRSIGPITTPAAGVAGPSRPPFFSLLTDWGARDPSAAICRGVILGIAPDALVVDITHEVAKYNIRHGALMLWCALPYLPIGAHVAVIDPGVGTARRPLAIQVARGDFLIGPDNGLLLPGAERLGGIVKAHQIENALYRLPVVTATFHGRDLFSPAAAHLALGTPIEEMGPAVDPAGLVQMDWPTASVRDGLLQTAVIYRDTFGNLKLAALAADMGAAFPDLARGRLMTVSREDGDKRSVEMPWAPTFGDVAVGAHLLYQDSYGMLCIAQNQGSAADSLGLAEGMAIRIELG
jgi:S-adenosylmethionine hydrolase